MPTSMGPSKAPSPASETKAIRFGRYRLLEMIGRGGMAEVYRAVAQGPGGFQRQFVLKRIRAEKTDSSNFVDMFINEARISALLEHPNIVQVYDFGEVGGDYFLAMEYLRGKDLLTVMRTLRSSSRDLPIAVAAFAAAETARGLAYAHSLSQGGACLDIVHRDVTPSNIMLLKTGGVKLLDFGIARAAMKQRTTTPIEGLIKGKFAYLSPEQVRGQRVDGRSDIFSLGVVLWECLTGQRLFWDPNDLQTMRNILDKSVPPPSMIRADVPAALDDVVLRALDRNAQHRFATAALMAEALSGYLDAIRFSSNDVARLLEEVFGSSSFNDDPPPEFAGSPIPPPPTPSGLIAQARAKSMTSLVGTEPDQKEHGYKEEGYSVVSSVRPLPHFISARSWQKVAMLASIAVVVLASAATLGWRLLDSEPNPAAIVVAASATQPALAAPGANAITTPSPPQPVVVVNSHPAAEPRSEGPAPIAAGSPIARSVRTPKVTVKTKPPMRAPAPTHSAEAPHAGVDLAIARHARTRGLEALNSGQMQTARVALEAALVGFPRDTEVLGGLAEAAFELGDLQTAHSIAKRATAAAPRVLKHHLLLGDVCLKVNKLREAVDAYRAAMALAPGDPGVRSRLTRAEMALSPPQ